MEQTKLEDRLRVAVETNEKFRSRARSLSTLCGTAAGALAAGQILGASEEIPHPAKLLGLISFVMLVAATFLGLVASTAFSYQPIEKSGLRRVLRSLEIWRVRTDKEKEEDAPSYKGLIAAAEILQKGIIRVLNFALWSLSLAAVTLIAAVVTVVAYIDASKTVEIEFNTPRNILSCPKLEQTFLGEVRDRDRKSSNALLPVRLSPEVCGNKLGATIYVDKSTVVIAG